MATEIKYNGNVIASVEAGKTATLPCKGKKMKSDIVVTAPAESGESGGSASQDLAVLVSASANVSEHISAPTTLEYTITEPGIYEVVLSACNFDF